MTHRASTGRGAAIQGSIFGTLCQTDPRNLATTREPQPNRRAGGRSGDARRPAASIPRLPLGLGYAATACCAYRIL